MSKATPLDQLPTNPQDRDIVQDVLDDLEDNIPDEVEYEEMDQQHQDRYRQWQHDQSQISQYQGNDYPKSGNSSSSNSREHFYQPSLLETILEEVKLPILFILLFVLLNNSMVREFVFKYLPEKFNSATYNLGARALAGSILFYLVKSLVLPLL